MTSLGGVLMVFVVVVVVVEVEVVCGVVTSPTTFNPPTASSSSSFSVRNASEMLRLACVVSVFVVRLFRFAFLNTGLPSGVWWLVLLLGVCLFGVTRLGDWILWFVHLFGDLTCLFGDLKVFFIDLTSLFGDLKAIISISLPGDLKL